MPGSSFWGSRNGLLVGKLHAVVRDVPGQVVVPAAGLDVLGIGDALFPGIQDDLHRTVAMGPVPSWVLGDLRADGLVAELRLAPAFPGFGLFAVGLFAVGLFAVTVRRRRLAVRRRFTVGHDVGGDLGEDSHVTVGCALLEGAEIFAGHRDEANFLRRSVLSARHRLLTCEDHRQLADFLWRDALCEFEFEAWHRNSSIVGFVDTL